MSFDIKKYEGMIFHDDEVIDKKIKALYLYFDYKVYDKKLNHDYELALVSDWIRRFENNEDYELIPAFVNKREEIIQSPRLEPVEEEVIVEEEVSVEPPKLGLIARIKKWCGVEKVKNFL